MMSPAKGRRLTNWATQVPPHFLKERFIYLFERERASMGACEAGRGKEGEGERESPADSPLSAEPNTGLDPRTRRSWVEIKSWTPNRLSHPGAPTVSSILICTFIYFLKFLFIYFLKILFIYLTEIRDSQREREHKQGEWERKKQAHSGGAWCGARSHNARSRPEPKADA